MKRIKTSWCSYCSTNKEDIRELEIMDRVLTCRNCKHQSVFVPVSRDSPFFYLLNEEEFYEWRRRNE